MILIINRQSSINNSAYGIPASFPIY